MERRQPVLVLIVDIGPLAGQERDDGVAVRASPALFAFALLLPTSCRTCLQEMLPIGLCYPSLELTVLWNGVELLGLVPVAVGVVGEFVPGGASDISGKQEQPFSRCHYTVLYVRHCTLTATYRYVRVLYNRR